MQIVSCSGASELAQQIAAIKGAKLIRTRLKEFSCGEYLVQLEEALYSDTIYIIQSLFPEASAKLVEFLLTVNAAGSAGAKNICAVIPYLSYSRQDRLLLPNSSYGLSFVANLLECSGLSKIVTLDIHNASSLNLFRIPIINIEAAEILPKMEGFAVVAPDSGSVNRARLIADLWGARLICLSKKRNKGKITIDSIPEDIPDKCLIVDDIIDSFCTMHLAATTLSKKGAKHIVAYATHNLLSKAGLRLLAKSPITKLITSDSTLLGSPNSVSAVNAITKYL